MILRVAGQPLELVELEVPSVGAGEVLVRVEACGVCRTDLHVADGELAGARLPLVLGHQIVGVVEHAGDGVSAPAVGARVGVPWLGQTCGSCAFCRTARENLCDSARFTGYHRDGGFADYAVADARYCFELDANVEPSDVAPLLCAGLIGYRAFRMAGDARRIGLYGFGAAAHIVTQVALHADREVYAFTRAGDAAAQRAATRLGARWAGASDEAPPKLLDAAIVFAPVGALVPTALRAVDKGGTVVCAGIHMSDIPSFPYSDLWGERSIRSVANLTRRDGRDFLRLAGEIPVRTDVHRYPLDRAGDALEDLRNGRFTGSAVVDVA